MAQVVGAVAGAGAVAGIGAGVGQGAGYVAGEIVEGLSRVMSSVIRVAGSVFVKLLDALIKGARFAGMFILYRARELISLVKTLMREILRASRREPELGIAMIVFFRELWG